VYHLNTLEDKDSAFIGFIVCGRLYIHGNNPHEIKEFLGSLKYINLHA
jgi:hypothetical protein